MRLGGVHCTFYVAVPRKVLLTAKPTRPTPHGTPADRHLKTLIIAFQQKLVGVSGFHTSHSARRTNRITRDGAGAPSGAHTTRHSHKRTHTVQSASAAVICDPLMFYSHRDSAVCAAHACSTWCSSLHSALIDFSTALRMLGAPRAMWSGFRAPPKVTLPHTSHGHHI